MGGSSQFEACVFDCAANIFNLKTLAPDYRLVSSKLMEISRTVRDSKDTARFMCPWCITGCITSSHSPPITSVVTLFYLLSR